MLFSPGHGPVTSPIFMCLCSGGAERQPTLEFLNVDIITFGQPRLSTTLSVRVKYAEKPAACRQMYQFGVFTV